VALLFKGCGFKLNRKITIQAKQIFFPSRAEQDKYKRIKTLRIPYQALFEH
jgi:hypothetical protein